MSELKIVIEKDQTAKRHYQLQLYANNSKLFKPFPVKTNYFAEVLLYAIKLKEKLEEDLKTEAPDTVIRIIA